MWIVRSFFCFFVFSEFFVVNLYCFYNKKKKKMKTLTETYTYYSLKSIRPEEKGFNFGSQFLHSTYYIYCVCYQVSYIH